MEKDTNTLLGLAVDSASAGSAYRWTVANDRTGEVTTYHSAMRKPVTERHVRASPKVKEWSGGDPLIITPQNT